MFRAYRVLVHYNAELAKGKKTTKATAFDSRVKAPQLQRRSIGDCLCEDLLRIDFAT